MEYVKTSLEQGVATIAIDHPPVNALSSKVFKEIVQAAKEFQENGDARAVILTGEGANFAAGADIKEIQGVAKAEEGEKLARASHEVLDALWGSPLPTIAAINGYCLGGGNELAMACHMRIATDKARFAQPEVKIGIIPGMGGSQHLPRLIGSAKALELLLTGEMMSAQEARAYGLVNLVVPEAELRRQAVGLAKRITRHGKPAVARILQSVREGMERPLKDALRLEAKLFGEIMETEDKAEGIAAFIEKRAPQFKDK